MRKRLRKKQHLREFTEYGFAVGFKFNFDDEKQRDSILDEFIEMIRSQELYFGGGGQEHELDGFVGAWSGSVTEEQRAAVTQWLAKHPQISAYAAGPLIDAWNAPMKEYDKPLEYITR